MMKNQAAFALLASAVFLLSDVSLAQAPVASREAVPAQTEEERNASTQLVLELQSLRQEISMLRGTIEELEYKVQRLERKQTENYADLDSRVANLYSGQAVRPQLPAQNPGQTTTVSDSAAASSAEPATTAVIPSTTPLTALQPNSAASVQSAPVSSEQESQNLYDQGFAALRQGNRETAIQFFDQLVTDYPNSGRAPDARYWLGETYWLANKKEQSRQSFVQLLELTPEYRKAGDAMYRLGVIYDQLGDFDTAFDYMSQVLLSGSSQAVAAQAWINEHQPQNNPDPQASEAQSEAQTATDQSQDSTP